MTKPMPSPDGTNRAGLFIGSRVEAAYDAMPDSDGDLSSKLISFLEGKLSDDDLATVRTMLGGGVPEMASDAAYVRSERARRSEAYRQGRITTQDMNLPIIAPRSGSAQSATLKRFPGMSRIGQV